jgi:hypothetical protein
MLERIEKSFFRIKDLLLENDDIRRLLVEDGPDALQRYAPSIEQAKEYIVLRPVIDLNDENYTRNTIGAITMPSIYLEDKYLSTRMFLTFYTQNSEYELNNEQLRLFRLADLAAQILNNKKLYNAGTLELLSIREVVMNSSITGIVLEFSIND